MIHEPRLETLGRRTVQKAQDRVVAVPGGHVRGGPTSKVSGLQGVWGQLLANWKGHGRSLLEKGLVPTEMGPFLRMGGFPWNLWRLQSHPNPSRTCPTRWTKSIRTTVQKPWNDGFRSKYPQTMGSLPWPHFVLRHRIRKSSTVEHEGCTNWELRVSSSFLQSSKGASSHGPYRAKP